MGLNDSTWSAETQDTEMEFLCTFYCAIPTTRSYIILLLFLDK